MTDPHMDQHRAETMAHGIQIGAEALRVAGGDPRAARLRLTAQFTEAITTPERMKAFIYGHSALLVSLALQQQIEGI